MNHTIPVALCMSLVLCGCDPSDAKDKSTACVLEDPSDPNTELFLLPTRDEAEKLHMAISHRHQGTVNLLLAKYDSKTVAGSTACTRLKTEAGFVEVKAAGSGLVGWLPEAQIKGE